MSNKIYVGLAVDSQGYDDGSEAYVIAASEDASIVKEALYQEYVETFNALSEYMYPSDRYFLPDGDFDEIIWYGVLLEFRDFHIQYEIKKVELL